MLFSSANGISKMAKCALNWALWESMPWPNPLSYGATKIRITHSINTNKSTVGIESWFDKGQVKDIVQQTDPHSLKQHF